MNHKTTIEIDENEVEVSIDFEMQFGEPCITLMTDVKTGDAIAPDLLGYSKTSDLLNELHEKACNEAADRLEARNERIHLENIID
jgi:hypothetical protein